MMSIANTALPPVPVQDLELILSLTKSCWEEARGKSFFITGGTGFFGIWLLETFVFINERLSLGCRAMVLTRSPMDFAKKAPHLANRPELSWITGDVCDFAFPAGIFPYVIHAATSPSLIGIGFGDLASEMSEGTKHVLEFAKYAGTEKLLFTSSGAVYGQQPELMQYIPEDYSEESGDNHAPKAAYGQGKRISEKMCIEQSRKYGYEAKIARCFAFMGPHLPLNGRFAIGNFLRDALLGRSISVQGDGSPVRSYLYAADLAIWLWNLLFRGHPGQAYNVGSSSALTIAELAGVVRSATGSLLPIQIKQPAAPEKTGDRYVPSVELARNDLGLKESISLPEALSRTAEWWKQATLMGYNL